MRRLPLIAAVVVAAVTAAWLLGRDAGSGAPAPGPPAAVARVGSARPDVVLVTIDTLRADALGFGGNERVETPILDRLAASGRVFTRAHAHNVVTLPSHANVLSGLYPFQHGVRENAGFVFPSAVPTVATILRGAGYRTGAFVGAFPLDSRFGLTRGFDVYDDHYRRGSDRASFVIAERPGNEVVAAALDWWRRSADTPRFLWVHLYDPHAAYEPPEPFRTRYRDNLYLGEVAATDSFLKPLLEPFLAGSERPALLVLTGDHGEALGEHGELTHGLFAYEATLHVPLVLWGDGVTPGRDDRSARHIDVVPTILARLGLEAPRRLPGRSLLAPPASEDSYFEALSTHLNRGWAPLFGLIRGDRKLIDLPLPELYDLATDPHEQHDRFAAERARAEALRAAIPAAARSLGARAETTPEEEARLRSLGYVVGQAPAKTSYGVEDDPKRLVGVDHAIHLLIDAYSRGRFAEAVERGRAVVAARPQMAEGYQHLALALRQLERTDEAIATLRAGLRRATDDRRLRRELGLTLAEAGHGAEAVAVLQPLADEADIETQRALSTALADAGRLVEARALLERTRAADPQDPLTYETLGVVALRQEHVDEAQGFLTQALALNDRLPLSWNTLGVVRYRRGDPVGALDAWQRAVAADAKLRDAWFNLGLVAAERGERELARRALRQYVTLSPGERFAADRARAVAVLQELGE